MESGFYSVTCVHARSSAYLLVLSGPIGGTLGLVLYGDFPIGRLHCAQECNSSIVLCPLPIGRVYYWSPIVFVWSVGFYLWVWCVCMCVFSVAIYAQVFVP